MELPQKWHYWHNDECDNVEKQQNHETGFTRYWQEEYYKLPDGKEKKSLLNESSESMNAMRRLWLYVSKYLFTKVDIIMMIFLMIFRFILDFTGYLR